MRTPGAATLLCGFFLAGCEEPPALQVADVPFLASELLGLSDEQEDRLAALAALGVAASRGELALLAEEELRVAEEDLRIRALRDRVALENAGLDEAALRELYRSEPEPELVVRHFVVLAERWESEAARDVARGRARAGLDRVRGGEPFERVAGAVSEEPGAEARGGLLDPGREGTWVREFWDAALALEPGQVSGVVETPYGFHVLRLDDRRPVPFEDAAARFGSRVAARVDDPARWEALVRDWMEDDANRMDGPVPTGDALRRRALLAEAELRRITPDPAATERLHREWELTAGGWAEALGFTAGIEPEEIAATALVALGRTDQTARILREELAPHMDAFLSAYPIERPEP